MADPERLKTSPRDVLFEELDKLRAGMLGVDGSRHPMQPMTHHLERESGDIWFIASRDSTLVQDIGDRAQARFNAMSTDQDFYASLIGPIETERDEAKLDEMWSVFAAAWFEGGRDDDRVALLRFRPSEAALWATTSSKMIFGIEIARATLEEDKTPDVGEHVTVDLREAA